MSWKLATRASLALILALAVLPSGEAIVKQSRSDDQYPAPHHQQSQSQSQLQAQQSAASGQQAAGNQQSPSQSQQQMQPVSNSASGQQASYQPQPSNSAANPQDGGYGDQMAAASSNQAHNSYQAAAQSVNMALASSGIYGPPPLSGSSSSQPASSSSSSSSSASSSSLISAPGSSPSQQSSVSAPQQQSQLSPLHYFYYPAKDGAAMAAAASSSQHDSSSVAKSNPAAGDLLNLAGTSNYQTLAYPSSQSASSYSDQQSLGAALDSASAHDSSYMSNGQLMAAAESSMAGAMYAPQPQQGQQHHHHYHQPQHHQSVGQPQHYDQQQAAQQQSGAVSFASPSQAQPDYQPQHQSQASLYGQQTSPTGSLFSHAGDLSTSGYPQTSGSSMQPSASYLSPAIQQQSQQQQQQQAPAVNNQQLTSADLASFFQSAAGNAFSNSIQQANNAAQAGSSSAFAAANPSSQAYLYSQNPFLAGLSDQSLSGMQAQASQQSATSGTPASGQVSNSNSGHNRRYGLSSFIMPMLALAGLSLLIPTMSNIGTAVGRKKRSVDAALSSASRAQDLRYQPLINGSGQLAKESSIGEYMDRIERYYSVYKNAVQSDDCMSRVICEFGDAIKDVTGKSAVVTVIEKLAPNWLAGKVHLFKEAALSDKDGKEKCKKFACKRVH